MQGMSGNTSHAAEACRLRAPRRAGCASEDAPGARRKTHRLRAGRCAGCAPHDAPLARRKTCRLRAARRAESAPRDAPVARRVRARARPFFSVEAGGASKLLAGGAGGWLTVRPPQAARGEGRPPLLAATGSSTQHLSQSRGALILPRSRASCSLASVGTRDVPGVRRKQKEERQPNTTRV